MVRTRMQKRTRRVKCLMRIQHREVFVHITSHSSRTNRRKWKLGKLQFFGPQIYVVPLILVPKFKDIFTAPAKVEYFSPCLCFSSNYLWYDLSELLMYYLLVAFWLLYPLKKIDWYLSLMIKNTIIRNRRHLLKLYQKINK